MRRILSDNIVSTGMREGTSKREMTMAKKSLVNNSERELCGMLHVSASLLHSSELF